MSEPAATQRDIGRVEKKLDRIGVDMGKATENLARIEERQINQNREMEGMVKAYDSLQKRVRDLEHGKTYEQARMAGFGAGAGGLVVGAVEALRLWMGW